MSLFQQDKGRGKAANPRDLIGSTIAGRYRVESLLGVGGMGAVYLVQHTGIRKRMALKVLSQKMMAIPAVVARFEREAMTAAHIEHPNVAAASDYGRTEDGRFYLVLEYVEGRELRAILDAARGPLPPPRALFITRQIATALDRAHALGIVHRDLKPENIMLVRRDGQDDFVKVLDFGLAQLSRHISAESDDEPAPSARKLTQVGEIFGTPAYMAPEQTVGDTVDIRTDLYGLGVILYELLAGVRPFVGKTTLELIQQHLVVPPPPMKDRAPKAKVSPALEALVRRLLEKQADDRFQTPQDLLRAIDELVAAESIALPGVAPLVKTDSPAAQAKRRASEKVKRAIESAGGFFAKRGLRKSFLRRVPLWRIIIGVIVVAVLIYAWRSAKDDTPYVPGHRPPPQARAVPSDQQVTPAAIDAASAQGPVALETLASRFPSDAQVLRALVKSHSGQRQHVEAMRAMAKLAAIDSSTGHDPEMVRIIVAALQSSADASQAAALLMEQELGEAGVDLLYDMTIKQTQARWKPRLNQSLTRPDVLAKASPATRVALELRAAKSCEAKRELLSRAMREGGERALGQLKGLTQTDGCGFLSLGDCWSCLRKTTALRDAIAALEARAK